MNAVPPGETTATSDRPESVDASDATTGPAHVLAHLAHRTAGQAAMVALVFSWRALATQCSVAKLMSMAARAGERALAMATNPLPPDSARTKVLLDEAARRAHRASRLVPGANCLHRALAARVYLAAQGLDARLAIGLRRRGQIEGHAWLVVSTLHGEELLFCRPDDGYREVLQESDVLTRVRFP